MTEIKIGANTFKHEGLTLIVGDFREYLKGIDTSEINTKATVIMCPECTMYERNMADFVKNMIRKYKDNGEEFVVITDSYVFIRAVECLTDLGDVMDKLNVYDVKKREDTFNIVNLMYSEYGLSDYYGAVGEAMEDLESQLERKYLS